VAHLVAEPPEDPGPQNKGGGNGGAGGRLMGRLGARGGAAKVNTSSKNAGADGKMVRVHHEHRPLPINGRALGLVGDQR